MKEDSPSNTATLVARSIVLASEDRELRKLVASGEVPILRQLLTAAGGNGWFEEALNSAGARRLLQFAERNLLPGIFAHYLARKRWIEAAVRRAIADGARQVVIVGAGFDTLAARLHREFSDVSFVELDHPATQLTKRQTLTGAPNLAFESIDLAKESLEEVMSSRSVFSWGGPSVAVVEGLTMYLPEERVSGLMRDLAAFCGRDGRIIFSFMEADESGSIQFRGESPLIDRWLGSCGEPFLWGISRADLPNFLRLSGLSNRELVDHMSLRSEILAPLELSHVPLAKGECLCLATPYSP